MAVSAWSCRAVMPRDAVDSHPASFPTVRWVSVSPRKASDRSGSAHCAAVATEEILTDPGPSVIEVRISGANCPRCLNATLGAIRSEPGVDQGAVSYSNGCLLIRHRGVSIERIVAIIDSHLRAVDTSYSETVMVGVHAEITTLGCQHC